MAQQLRPFAGDTMAKKPQDFVNKEELPSFEEWIEIQAFDRLRSTQEELTTLRRLYDQVVGRALATPKFGRMNLFAGLSYAFGAEKKAKPVSFDFDSGD